jgi:hypothetical protein
MKVMRLAYSRAATGSKIGTTAAAAAAVEPAALGGTLTPIRIGCVVVGVVVGDGVVVGGVSVSVSDGAPLPRRFPCDAAKERGEEKKGQRNIDKWVRK